MRSIWLSLVLVLVVSLLSLRSMSGSTAVDAGTAVRLGLHELAANAELVVEGVVRSARPLVSADGRLETEYLFESERTFWGEQQPSRSLRLPGGVLADGSGMLLPGVPRLVTGERCILFLTREGETGVRMPVGLGQGRLEVLSVPGGGRMVAREFGATGLVDPGSGGVVRGEGLQLTDYAAFAAALEVELARRRVGEEGR